MKIKDQLGAVRKSDKLWTCKDKQRKKNRVEAAFYPTPANVMWQTIFSLYFYVILFTQLCVFMVANINKK